MADDWRGSKSKIYIELPQFNRVYLRFKVILSASNVYKGSDVLFFPCIQFSLVFVPSASLSCLILHIEIRPLWLEDHIFYKQERKTWTSDLIYLAHK